MQNLVSLLVTVILLLLHARAEKDAKLFLTKPGLRVMGNSDDALSNRLQI